ncbi:sec1 family domain-containing 2 [Paramuricea clavata]|uniref:Sec1 family domain-containing 2 n=1 Tax=Paramuricea clavata TaxID=317549 RepID=A0A6S7IK97_PARCT|nr:sec1 family domain-containing 2 [Paramuricea clavata]
MNPYMMLLSDYYRLLQKYDFTYKHKPGKDLVVADTLSRATTDSELEREISCYVHMVMSNLPATDDMMARLRMATEEDESLRQLKKTVLSGWPDTKRETPVKIKEYWHCREEISEIDGILLKNEKIIIPSSFRPEMLEKIHAGHMGTEKCKKRARDVLYWPGMNSQIEEMVLKCPTCLEYRPSNQKEPMIVQPTPTIPWDTVATDLFYWNNSNYLLVVDYFLRYFEIAKLPDIKSSTLVTYMKSIFARHGIPREVKSDNGPQYTSQEFGNFSQEWNFQHATTSPYHPQANGLAERSVQTVKNLLNKAHRDGRDPYVSILEYRNTPIDQIGSPAQLLMSRRLRSVVPTTKSLLQPKVIDEDLASSKLITKKTFQKLYYDRGSKELPTISQGEQVRIKQGKIWNPAVVTNQAHTPRSYIVQSPDGSTYRRNSKHILKTKEGNSQSFGKEDCDDPISQSNEENAVGTEPANDGDNAVSTEKTSEEQLPVTLDKQFSASPLKTRSGRIIRKPNRYKDY